MMTKRQVINFLLPPVLFLLMLLDGHVSSIFRSWTGSSLMMFSNLLLLLIMFATFQVNKTYLVILTLVIGVLADSYYYNIIGVYALLLPLLVLVIYGTFEHVIPTTFTIILSFIVFLTLFEVGNAAMQMIFQLTQVNMLSFLTKVLGPTLFVNIIFVCCFVWPLKKVFNIKK